jgi:hypothetical protein
VIAITDPIAWAAAVLKRDAGMAGVAATIDALVVATSAAAGGGVVLTSDVDDIRALTNAARVRIRPVRI